MKLKLSTWILLAGLLLLVISYVARRFDAPDVEEEEPEEEPEEENPELGNDQPDITEKPDGKENQ